MIRQLILTCEHASQAIPKQYAALFRGEKASLNSHVGYDIGAREIFEFLASKRQVPSHVASWSRLLIDLNRSVHHPRCFSRFSNRLSDAEKHNILTTVYFPYREAVQASVEAAIKQNKSVLHLSIHSFTPIIEGLRRKADIGLLYDPARSGEKSFCQQWQVVLKELAPDYHVRRNYPYRGVSDGLVTHLRKLFLAKQYIAIELEINQRHLATSCDIRKMAEVIQDSLSVLL